MTKFPPTCLVRRLFLLQSMLMGLTLYSGGCARLPIRQGIHRMDSPLLVNGHPVGPEAVIQPGHTVTTGNTGQTVLVIGTDAFLLGATTTVLFHPTTVAATTPKTGPITTVTGFTLQAGRILSVFGTGPKTLKVPSAVIGIRGTGLFLQVETNQDYMCLCYGEADIRMNTNPSIPIHQTAKHHDVPSLLTKDGQIRKVSMDNHTDEELIMLEFLVGREPPFSY